MDNTEEMERLGKVKIDSISVTKLYGVHNHTIPFKENENIRIIHGANGLGKTAFLSLINAGLKMNFFKLSLVTFEKLTFEICIEEEKYILTFETILNGEDKQFKICYLNANNKNAVHDIMINPKGTVDTQLLPFPLGLIEDVIPDITRYGEKTWKQVSTNENLELIDIVVRNPEYFPEDIIKYDKDLPSWLIKIKESIPTKLIETQRLISTIKSANYRKLNSYRRFHSQPETTVMRLSKLLISKIEDSSKAYGELSQERDRTFPIRVMENLKTENFDMEEIQMKFDKLEQKRNKLVNLGLLDTETFGDLSNQIQVDATTQKLFATYISDMEDKLAVFDELVERIEVLKEIVGQKFIQKTLMISKEKGIYFKTKLGDELEPDKLSSGEQHQIVLLMDLLFECKPNSLVLIDEPELSFHIGWQISFLDDLTKISDVQSLSFILATHAPAIINDRWDLTVNLKEGYLEEGEV